MNRDTAESNKKTKEILDFLCWYGIPLHYSVNLLAKTMNIHLSHIAAEAGVTKTYLYLCLAGKRNVSREIRRAMQNHLGVDVWRIAQDYEVEK